MLTTLDIAPAGMALLDADGRVLGASPGFSQVLACGESPVGHELGDLLDNLDDPERVAAALCLVAAPLELEEGPAVSYCLVRDITDQRLAAAAQAHQRTLHQATPRS